MVPPESYKNALAQAQADLSAAVQERAKWTREVGRLEQLVKSLASVVIQNSSDTVSELVGLQELVFSCICSSPTPVTAGEIWQWLLNLGYDPQRYKNPLAVVHSALNRLQRAGQIMSVGIGRFAAVALVRPRQRRK